MKKLMRLPRRALEKINAQMKYVNIRRKYQGFDYIPKILSLEVTNRCNSNCVFCGRESVQKPLMDMDIELFKTLVDKMPFVTQVHTQGFGEPLLYPYLVEAVQYVTDSGKRAVFYTNGSLLDVDKIHALLDAGLGQIRFSVDADNKVDYEKMRKGLDWDVVEGNIIRFQLIKNQRKVKTETVVRICETRENTDRINEIVEFWSNVVDVVVVNPERNVPSAEVLGGFPFVNQPVFPMKCDIVDEQMMIKSNGDVVLCCNDWFHNYVLGNVSEGEITTERLLKIFNSDDYNEIRDGMKTGNRYPVKCYSCQGHIEPMRNE